MTVDFLSLFGNSWKPDIWNSTRSTIRCREHRRAASSAPFWPTFICTSLISSWKEYLLNTPKGNSGDHIVNIRFSNTNETVQKRKAIRNKRMSTCGKCRISPALDPMDKNYQRVKYVRYAERFCGLYHRQRGNSEWNQGKNCRIFRQKELHLDWAGKNRNQSICRINEWLSG